MRCIFLLALQLYAVEQADKASTQRDDHHVIRAWGSLDLINSNSCCSQEYPAQLYKVTYEYIPPSRTILLHVQSNQTISVPSALNISILHISILLGTDHKFLMLNFIKYAIFKKELFLSPKSENEKDNY